jgi:acetyl-CoA carboxylase beta subunit
VLGVSLAWGAQAYLHIAEPRAALIAFLNRFFWAAVIAHLASLIVQRAYAGRS